MAKSKDNLVMQGTSGKIGKNLAFRQRGDQSVIGTGMAQPLDSNHLLWRYVMTVANPDFQASSFRFTLLDTPQKLTIVVIPYQLYS